MGFLKTTWRHVRRSPYQAFAAILITSLTFFVISIFTLVIFGSSKIISYFESKPQVTAFFKNEAKKESIDALKKQLESSDKVAKIKYVSKEEALKIYREQNKDDPLLLELVTADILPASLEISATKIDYLTDISDSLKNSPFVSEVIFQKDIISTLTSWTNAIRKIGVVLVFVLALVSVFVMVTIIGIKISQRREEIEIMRLIGATYWYIRWPFILEGILYGVIGAFFGWAFSSLAIWYATPFLSSFLQGIPMLPVSPIFLLEILGANVSFAIFLGIFSSFLAVLRYLK
ncbi:MAG: permease-like cell division protein FtsX [Candidatus Levybacteria bacterium]|nr:permease-like cell division protein FtsX [Candidatus Levybacteria bacterium]